jgi:hypothetical protein
LSVCVPLGAGQTVRTLLERRSSLTGMLGTRKEILWVALLDEVGDASHTRHSNMNTYQGDGSCVSSLWRFHYRSIQVHSVEWLKVRIWNEAVVS